ncbi:PREDICTED: probable E3 ubiquitin-protein ligase LUL4 [Erythranthe guttata]|nr:PREDICTED: probable E3 ubiquitin-protein ligase LUL4 [Erythranthe guttata]|eukprot:XP_012827819.1 PREDICTED: probable E3 ubiquitin-protein ligase LUL4 [Erythranthe guttata]
MAFKFSWVSLMKISLFLLLIGAIVIACFTLPIEKGFGFVLENLGAPVFGFFLFCSSNHCYFLIINSITIYYFAKEETNRRVVPLFPETYVPIKVPFRKGLHQEFRQPSGTGIDFRFFPMEDLSHSPSRYEVFPIVVSADTCPTPYIIDERSYLLSHTFRQMQITQVIVGKNHEAQFTAKVIRQLLWTGDVCYELREIYGLGKSGPGKDCVVCMTEPKDIALLPCRHMCMCSGCAKALRLQSNKCPICRETIEAVLEIKIDTMDFSHKP